MPLVQIEPRHTTAPPWHHLILGDPAVVLMVEGSRIYALSPELVSEFAADERALEFLRSPNAAPEIHAAAYPSAISLNIAQSCNLSCAYCYADEGRFGGPGRMMSEAVAIQSIQRLFERSASKAVSVGFIGGEPLMNRAVLHACVRYATTESERRGIPVTFGITTNGALLREADLNLFRSHRFAVTVSLDGGRAVNDALRRSRTNRSGFDAIVRRVRPLLEDPGLSQVAARATLTRVNMGVGDCVETLAAEGFREIGVSPLRTGPDSELCLGERDWAVLLSEMKSAGRREWERVRTGGEFRFSNLALALKKLHAGESHALPCASATNYVSVSATGDYYTCHRTVGDAAFWLGSAESGPGMAARQSFTAARHVDQQTPCRDCWARYICGGGCHVEVIAAGRAGCDYIRGWLEFAIALYPRLLAERPDLLQGAAIT